MECKVSEKNKNTLEPLDNPCIKIFKKIHQPPICDIFEKLRNSPSFCNNGFALNWPVTSDKDADTIVPSAAMESIELEYISTTM